MTPPQSTPTLSTLEQLVKRLSKCHPPQWCLIAPNGQCYLGPEPMVLAAQATYKPLSVHDIRLTKEGGNV